MGSGMMWSRDGNSEASTSTSSLRPGSPHPSDSSSNHPPNVATDSGRVARIFGMHGLAPPGPMDASHSRLGTRHPDRQTPPGPWFLPSPLESAFSGAPPRPLPFRIPHQFHSMVSGAGAGFVASIVTCPLDVIKTRLQAQHLARDSKEYEGVRLTILRIWRQAGVRGFYRGLGPTLGGYLPTWGIYFTVYDEVKDRFGGYVKRGEHPEADTTMLHIVAAMTAGATGTVMTNPLWVVKTRFMAQAVLPPSAKRYRNTLEAFATIYRTEGFRAFYKGLLPSLIGVSHVAVQFPLYEKAKSWADTRSGGNGDHSTLTPGTILACSAGSKMVASLATYPHEVLRTRLQIRKSSDSHIASAGGGGSGSGSGGNGGNGGMVRGPGPRPHLPTIPHLAAGGATLYSPLVTGSNPPLPLPEPGAGIPRIAAPGQKWAGRPGGVIDTFLQIKRQDGWRGFYRGLSINLVRTVPNSAVTMLTYELIMRRLAASD